MKLLDDYENSLQAIYDHVGFKEDWVIYPIDNRTEMYWKIVVDGSEKLQGEEILYKQSIKYAETLEKFNTVGDCYVDEIYTQRFYDKHIYRGEDITMIFARPHVDGMIYFAIFDNKKEVK